MIVADQLIGPEQLQQAIADMAKFTPAVCWPGGAHLLPHHLGDVIRNARQRGASAQRREGIADRHATPGEAILHVLR